MSEIRKLFLVAAVILFVFGYAGYLLWGKIGSVQALYTESYEELLSLEKKQEQITQLQEEFASTEKNREEIFSSLLSQGEALTFIVRIEDVARKAGLSYDVQILREITEEFIEQERLALRQSRRKTKKAEEALDEKLPGIVFSVGLDGSYSGVIRFLEGVATLPYYTYIDSFNISGGERSPLAGGGSETKFVKATIQITVFTKK